MSMPTDLAIRGARTSRHPSYWQQSQELSQVQAFFRAPADEFQYPGARRDFFVQTKKLVQKEMKGAWRSKQDLLHQALKMFLRIQTYDNKRLKRKARDRRR